MIITTVPESAGRRPGKSLLAVVPPGPGRESPLAAAGLRAGISDESGTLDMERKEWNIDLKRER